MYNVYVPKNPNAIIFKNSKFRFNYSTDLIKNNFKLLNSNLYAVEWINYFAASFNMDNIEDFKDYQKIILFDNDKQEYYCFNVDKVVFNSANRTNVTVYLELDVWFELSKINNWSVNCRVNFSNLEKHTITKEGVVNKTTFNTLEGIDSFMVFKSIEKFTETGDIGLLCKDIVAKPYYDSDGDINPYFKIPIFDNGRMTSVTPGEGIWFVASDFYDVNNSYYSTAGNIIKYTKLFFPNSNKFTDYSFRYENVPMYFSNNLTGIMRLGLVKYKINKDDNIYRYGLDYSIICERANVENLYYIEDKFLPGGDYWENPQSDLNESNFLERWKRKIPIDRNSDDRWSNGDINAIKLFDRFLSKETGASGYVDWVFCYGWLTDYRTNNAIDGSKQDAFADCNGFTPTFEKIKFKESKNYWDYKINCSTEFNKITIQSCFSSFDIDSWNYYINNNELGVFFYEYMCPTPNNYVKISFGSKIETGEWLDTNNYYLKDVTATGMIKTNGWYDYLYSNASQYQVAASYASSMYDVTQQQNKLAKKQAIASAVINGLTGGIGGAVGGAITGGKTAGAGGAVAGAVIGGATGLASGITNGIFGVQATELNNKKNLLTAQNSIDSLNALQTDLSNQTNLTYSNVDYQNAMKLKGYSTSYNYIIRYQISDLVIDSLKLHFFMYGWSIKLNDTITSVDLTREFNYFELSNCIYENVPLILQNALSELLENGVWVMTLNDYSNITNLKDMNGWSE